MDYSTYLKKYPSEDGYFGKFGGNPGKFFLRNVTGCLYTERRTSGFGLAGSLNLIIV